MTISSCWEDSSLLHFRSPVVCNLRDNYIILVYYLPDMRNMVSQPWHAFIIASCSHLDWLFSNGWPDLFSREHPAEEVFVTGTFDDWSKSEKLVKTGDVFLKDVQLANADEKIYYKVSNYKGWLGCDIGICFYRRHPQWQPCHTIMASMIATQSILKSRSLVKCARPANSIPTLEACVKRRAA